MGFSQVSKKTKKTYYLHYKKCVNKQTDLFFFNSKEVDSIDLPKDYEVLENLKTGLPYIKKIKGD